ncbi:hypothetical protein FSPOR_8012 [Fusarium sporotrichioides]|uniref:Uncharacterized protein n=1 Tax=Fusarium sporotrichioides TaxID=5514 RepID=A0A395RW09_FUSSP|nr:hypothetical protein FSPOR_8012 [Fusarium sporotrichioides]
MSVSSVWQSASFSGLTSHQLEVLYEPIVLESALIEFGTTSTYTHKSQSLERYEAEMPDLKAFQFYVNKLAQVCDNERGGDTISALAILQGSAGPNYVFGSNSKDARGLKTTKDFVQALLDLLGKNPEGLQIVALGKRVLWFMLSFNIARLKEYLHFLREAVQECLESCKRWKEDEIAEDKSQDSQLLQAADDLTQMGVDDIVRASQRSKNFRPLLHAEVPVYEHLSKNRQTAAECYWNRWNYIGSSKPTCRLCRYYFEALKGDKPGVRSSHNNLYRNWRLPECQDNESLGVARDELPSELAQRLRSDVVETLKEKRIRRKARDSDTYSSFPEILRVHDDSSVALEYPDRKSTASTDSQGESVVQLERATGAMTLG